MPKVKFLRAPLAREVDSVRKDDEGRDLPMPATFEEGGTYDLAELAGPQGEGESQAQYAERCQASLQRWEKRGAIEVTEEAAPAPAPVKAPAAKAKADAKSGK